MPKKIKLKFKGGNNLEPSSSPEPFPESESNAGIIFLIISLVVLLFILIGVAAYFLLKGDGGDDSNGSGGGSGSGGGGSAGGGGGSGGGGGGSGGGSGGGGGGSGGNDDPPQPQITPEIREGQQVDDEEPAQACTETYTIDNFPNSLVPVHGGGNTYTNTDFTTLWQLNGTDELSGITCTANGGTISCEGPVSYNGITLSCINDSRASAGLICTDEGFVISGCE